MAKKESNAIGDAEGDGNDDSDEGVDDKDDDDDDDLRGGGGGGGEESLFTVHSHSRSLLSHFSPASLFRLSPPSSSWS